MAADSPEPKEGNGRYRTVFHVPGMDCPSEERIIRMALDGCPGIRALAFDLERRRLTVDHGIAAAAVQAKLEPLRLGSRIARTTVVADAGEEQEGLAKVEALERRTLIILLAINATMFVVEQAAGWSADSAGLIADSLDMFADAAVYGLALYAVGRAASHKLRAAHLSGWLQLSLALGAFAEVLRRFVFGSEPEPPYMMAVALLALLANVTCLSVIARHRHGGPHMKASWIFSTNDVIANLGVIAAGALVAWTGSHVPDVVIGAIIAAVVLSGGMRIVRLR